MFHSMRPFLFASILAIAVCVAAPVTASAQGTGTSSSTQKPKLTPPKPKGPPKPKLPMEYRVFGVFEPQFMTASKTFNGVTGSSVLLGYGGGGEVLNVWQKLFVRGGVTFASATGTSGDVVDGVFLPKDPPIPLNQKFTTIELGAGWRTPLKTHPKMAIYVGGGAVILNASEGGDLATADENVSEHFTGVAGEVGLDWKLSKASVFSLEGQYRSIPSNPPHGSIQDQFGESNLGGFAVRAMFAISFTQKPSTPKPPAPKKK
jgi:hypothetical protein